MELSAISIGKYKAPREVKRLYTAAFPKHERLPWWVLRLWTAVKGVELTCYTDENGLCGFTYTVTEGDVLFVMFLAVNGKIRGRGYGSAVLELLKKTNPARKIILNVEPLDDTADNAEERVNRMRFYAKNGFFDTGYNIDEVGGTFRVLSTERSLDPAAYVRVFQKISFGLWRPKITKVCRD